MGKTSRCLAAGAAALMLSAASMAADTTGRTANPTAGVDTGTGCDQLTGKDREICLQNLPGKKGSRSSVTRDRSASARDRDSGASTGATVPDRPTANSGSSRSTTRSGEVQGPNANSGVDTGSGCDQLTGEDRQQCLRNLPGPRGTRR